MNKNTKNVLAGVGLLATGVAIGLALVKLIRHADMVCAKYGLIDWEEDEYDVENEYDDETLYTGNIFNEYEVENDDSPIGFDSLIKK